jgi:lipoprotein-anchoring transpeptidase ErfK/SrfK
MTTAQQQRINKRAERMRREERRWRQQRALLVLVLAVLVVAGIAFALRPSAATSSGTAGTVAQVTTTRTAEGTESAAATKTVTPAKPKPTRKTTKAAVASPIPAVLKPLKPAPGVKTIVVDRSDQVITLYKADGAPVAAYRCSSGIVYPRVGTYHVYGHRKQSWSESDDSTFFYFTMFVKSDKGNNIGFHSVPQTPDGKLVGKLGVPVSHGCVRLAKSNAKFVYTWAAVGTKVVVKK